MAARPPGPRKKKLPRWRARVCNCSLYERSHTIRSKKAWRKHQLQLGKLLAGARDAQPNIACAAGQQSADSNFDVNSSVLTDQYRDDGTDYPSLQGDELPSHGGGNSAGDLGTTSSSERLQRCGISPSFPTTTATTSGAQSRSLLSHTAATSSGASTHSESESNGELGRPGPYLPDSPSTTESEGSTSISSNGLGAGIGGSNPSPRQRITRRKHQAEIRFLEEVETLIGNPDDWTSSEDESVAGDPFEVGLMKRGFIDEDVLEDCNPDLLDIEEAVAGLRFPNDENAPEDFEPIFSYENEKGWSCRHGILLS